LLNQQSTYSGATDISTLNILGGTVTVGGDIMDTLVANAAAHTGTLTLNGGTLDLQGHNIGGASAANNIDVLNFQSGTLQNVNHINNGADLVKTTTGTLVLAGTNSYAGATDVQNGTVSFSTTSAGATSQGLGVGTTINLGVAAASSGVLNYTGIGGTLDKAINALGNGLDTVQNTGSGQLTLSGAIAKNGTTLTFKGGSSGINVTGQITGASASSDLIIGPGTTILANANNSYNGPTTVQSTGKLVVTGAITGTGNTVTVQSGGILAGSGSIAAAVSISGGTITAGSGNTANDSVGKLTMSASSGNELAASGTTTYDWKYASAAGADTSPFTNAGTNWDVLSITNLSVTNTVDVVPIAITGATSFNPGTNYQFDIATNVGANYATLAAKFQLDMSALTNTFAPAVGANSSNFSIGDDSANGGEIYINYSAAPEPTSMMLLGLGVCGMTLRRRRRASKTAESAKS
jgi:autotransporter-associated beta strand protein